MRILVDTSVWADFFNGYPSPEAETLADLIADKADVCTCGILVAEVFQGFRKEKRHGHIVELFEQLTFLEPSGIALYVRAAGIYRALRGKGKTVRSTIDCVIAALAEETRCYVLARDRDLALILGSGLVRAAGWPGGRVQ